MIRSNYRLIDPRDLTPQERGLRIMELHVSVRERMKREKKNPLPPPQEKVERLGTRRHSPQGRVPFGFQQNPYGRAAHETEAKWVQRIQALASQKFSSEKIAQALNKEDHETKRAGKWSRTAVWRILQRSQKAPVTKSFRNGTARTPKSRSLPVTASKTPPSRIRTSLSTENVLPPNSEFPKPLHINDFQKTLRPSDSNSKTTPHDLPSNWIWHRGYFGQIFEDHGRKRLVSPEKWAAHQKARALKAPQPKPPAIQNLLRKAYQLKERLNKTAGLTRLALAHELAIDPSQLTKLLNLLDLAPKIQTYIWGLQPTIHRSPIKDDDWNRLARIRDRTLQIQEFEILLAARMRHFTTSPDSPSQSVRRELVCA